MSPSALQIKLKLLNSILCTVNWTCLRWHKMKKQLCQQSLDFENEIREFRGQPQALKLLPINRSNGFENVLKREDELQENLKFLDITTTSKRRKLSRQKIKKKAKNVEAEFSSKVKKAKKSEKTPSARRISGEITKSFLVISSPSGSRYTVIQTQSSAGSVESHNRQETHDAYVGSKNEVRFHSP